MLSTDLDNVHSRLSFTVGVFSLPKPVVLHETVQLSALPCCSFHFMSFYCLLSAVITRQNLFSGDLFPWTRHAYSNTVVSAKVTKRTKKPLLISASCVINDTYCFFYVHRTLPTRMLHTSTYFAPRTPLRIVFMARNGLSGAKLLHCFSRCFTLFTSRSPPLRNRGLCISQRRLQMFPCFS